MNQRNLCMHEIPNIQDEAVNASNIIKHKLLIDFNAFHQYGTIYRGKGVK